MNKLVCVLAAILVAVVSTGCMMAIPAMSAASTANFVKHNQGRSEEVDFVYAKDKVVVGVTTKADITKNLGEPNRITQDANEVWKFEHRVLYGFGSGSAGDFTQVFVAFNNDGIVTAIAGSELQQKKEVKFAKGDLHVLPFMIGQSVNRIVPPPVEQRQTVVPSQPAVVEEQLVAPVKKTKAKSAIIKKPVADTTM